MTDSALLAKVRISAAFIDIFHVVVWRCGKAGSRAVERESTNRSTVYEGRRLKMIKIKEKT